MERPTEETATFIVEAAIVSLLLKVEIRTIEVISEFVQVTRIRMATAMPNNVGSGSPKMTVGDGGGSIIDNDEGKKSNNRVMPCMTSSVILSVTRF